VQTWRFALRKPLFYPLNYRNNDISILDFRLPIANSESHRGIPVFLGS
jgi:hypothetical protein